MVAMNSQPKTDMPAQKAVPGTVRRGGVDGEEEGGERG